MFFIITFCIGFTRTEKKYVKVINDDICNREIGFKAKSDIMKMNRSCKELTRKYGVLNVKGYFHSVIFFTKFDFYNATFESLFSQIIII